MAHSPRVNRRKRYYTRARQQRLDDRDEARQIARGLGLLHATDAVELAALMAEDEEESDDLAC